jgi:hypothetical protein
MLNTTNQRDSNVYWRRDKYRSLCFLDGWLQWKNRLRCGFDS